MEAGTVCNACGWRAWGGISAGSFCGRSLPGGRRCLGKFATNNKGSGMDESKSVLDEARVDDKAFPLGTTKEKGGFGGTAVRKAKNLIIVGACPQCNAPIYGPEKVALEPGDVVVRRSCDCRDKK